MYNYYNKRLRPFARHLRNNSTKAEIRIWCELLKNKQMMGFSFLRQRPVDQFIADFFCKELKLIIEADGYTHEFEEVFKRDQVKTKRLTDLGYAVLRFKDEEIIKDLENVRRVIEDYISEYKQ